MRRWRQTRKVYNLSIASRKDVRFLAIALVLMVAAVVNATVGSAAQSIPDSSGLGSVARPGAAQIDHAGDSFGPIRARSVSDHTFATYNMQGGSGSNGSKWSTDVRHLTENFDVVALQEAGPQPPGDLVARFTVRDGFLNSREFFQYLWNLGTDERPDYRYITFSRTDTGGNRVNLAIVTRVNVNWQDVTFAYNPTVAGRDAIGVRLRTTDPNSEAHHWFFNLHANSGNRGGDAATLLTRIDNLVPDEEWVAMGDFNREPRALANLIPPGSEIVSSGAATQRSGNQLDYFVGSTLVDCNTGDREFAARLVNLPSGALSDHRAVGSFLRDCNRATVLRWPHRVEPVGASITQGVGSSHGTGYRLNLYRPMCGMSGSPNCQYSGRTAHAPRASTRLDFVGRLHHGGGVDPDHEGYSGYRIDQVAGTAACSIPKYRPSIVTLVVGTNDILQNSAVEEAPSRLKALIDQIVRDSPRVTVLFSMLPPVTSPNEPGASDRVNAFNSELPIIEDELTAEGKRVRLVRPGFTSASMSADGIHPNDAGYQQLADAFLDGIKLAESDGRLQQPEEEGDFPAGCPTGGDNPVNDDRWTDHGVNFTNLKPSDNLRFGNVNEDNRPELFVIDSKQNFTYYWNGGHTFDNWTWTPGIPHAAMAPGLAGHTLRFADLDGEGHADCISFDGNARLRVSFFDIKKPVGQRLCANPAKLDWNIPGYVSRAGDQFFILDHDGDGKDDFILSRADGEARVWNNRYTPGETTTWNGIPGIAAGPVITGAVYRWADIDGDGRADRIQLTPQGGAVAWLSGYRFIGRILNDTGLPPSEMRFIDVGGNGKADLLHVDPRGSMHTWVNKLAIKPTAPSRRAHLN